MSEVSKLLRLEIPKSFPWELKLFRGDVEMFRIDLAHSSNDKTLQDCLDAVNWPHKKRAEIQKHQTDTMAFAHELVQAANAFPALVAALERAKEHLPTRDALPLRTKTKIGETLDIIDAALDQARGQDQHSDIVKGEGT